MNGLTNEALLAVVEDRLQAFKDGPAADAHTRTAYDFVHSALRMLHARTALRVQCRVEGTSQPLPQALQDTPLRLPPETAEEPEGPNVPAEPETKVPTEPAGNVPLEPAPPVCVGPPRERSEPCSACVAQEDRRPGE